MKKDQFRKHAARMTEGHFVYKFYSKMESEQVAWEAYIEYT